MTKREIPAARRAAVAAGHHLTRIGDVGEEPGEELERVQSLGAGRGPVGFVGAIGELNVAACLVVFLKLGWVSVACVFLSYFFMSIMFATIFALGIFGLGARAKRASAYIVMAIMGGALLPKLMGYVADKSDISRGFIVPLVCFAFVAFYGLNWPRFSGGEWLEGGR